MELNTEMALANLGHDVSLYQFLMQSLIDELPQYIEALETSSVSTEQETAPRIAHVIKGHLLMFGCETDAASCNQLQHQLSQCEHRESYQALITQLLEIASSFLEALRAQQKLLVHQQTS